ncbi:MAG: efflux RND transporter periplasmic adaptor subunit [Saprospiraceae bacterium]
MKNIFTIAVISVIALSINACGSKSPSPNTSVDKQARLTELKNQIAALEKEAVALELEINPEGKAEKTKLVSVQSFPTTLFRNYIDLQGTVMADQELFINAKMPGTITQIMMKTGDRVTKGQTVAVLDDVLIKQGMAELDHQLAFATEIYEKQKALWDQKIGTEVQYLSAKNNKESLEKRISTTKEQLDQTKVIAPISGIVDEVTVKPGQGVSPGMPLARLVNFSKLDINTEVPESFAGRVKAGNAIKIFFPDINKEYDSKITYVSPIINPINRTFKVKAALPANMQGVLPNMISIIKIIDYSNPKATVIPINYLQKDSKGDFVMVADSIDGHWAAAKKPIIIGKFYNDMVEVKSGIDDKSKLITLGYQDLIEGQKLSVQNQ